MRTAAADDATTYRKSTQAVLDYTVDWSDQLATGDTIADATWIVPGGITEVATSWTDTTATIVVSGGTDGETYRLTVRVTTAGGKKDDRTIKVSIDGDWPVASTTTTAQPVTTTTQAPTTTTAEPTTTTTVEPGQPGTYTVSGPTSAEVRCVPLGLESNAAASTFTVSLVEPYTTTVVTPSDGDALSTFDPPSVALTAESPSQAIDYSPGTIGDKSITFANDRGISAVVKAFNVTTQHGSTINSSILDPRWPTMKRFPDLGGKKVFGDYDASRPLSWIHKNIANDPVDANNDWMMSLYSDAEFLAAYPGCAAIMPWNIADKSLGGSVGNVVALSQPLVPITVYSDCPSCAADPLQEDHPGYPTEADQGPFRIPPLATAGAYFSVPVTVHGFPGDEYRDWAERTDQHVIVYSPDEDMLYEMFGAYTQDGGESWQCSSNAMFNCATGALRRDAWTSGDAAGHPIFPFWLRYDECARGEINHALRFTLRHEEGIEFKCMWPARHGAGYNWMSVANGGRGMPLGARVRLREDVYQTYMDLWSPPHPQPENEYGTAASYAHGRAIITALRNYGMVMNDWGQHWQVGVCMDARWDLHTFWRLWAGREWDPTNRPMLPTDFEILEIPKGCSITGPSTGQVGQPSVFTVSRIPIDDKNYEHGIYLYHQRGEQEWWFGPATLDEDHPSQTITVTPQVTGDHTLTPYQDGYWLLPDPLPFTVS